MIEIRNVEADEWPTVRDVRLAALKDAPDWFWSTFDQEVSKPEEWWRSFIQAGTWLIAFDDGTPVGIVAVIRAAGAPAQEHKLISMWVAPRARTGA